MFRSVIFTYVFICGIVSAIFGQRIVF